MMLWIVALVTVASLSGQCASQTVADLIGSNPNLSQLKNLINTNNSDLLSVSLQSPAPELTVFAPGNTAIERFARDFPEVAGNASSVRNLILNHVLVNVSVKAADVKSNLGVFSAIGYPLWFYKTTDGVTVNEGKVVLGDLMATNGIIHIIDKVLYPLGTQQSVGETVMMRPEYSGLKAFVDKSQEVSTILLNKSRLFTLFTPTNEAIPSPAGLNNNDIDAILKRHVCVETVLFANYFDSDRRIETFHGDILTKKLDEKIYVMNGNDMWSRVVSKRGIPTINGVLHQINGVLGVTSGVNLVEALGLNGLTQLENKVMQEGLNSALSEPDNNYTIFAPSNAAFDRFTLPSNVPLSTILNRHVIKGTIFSDDLKDTQSVQTLNSGEMVVITKDQGKVFLHFMGTKAIVISANKAAANGVIHIIDTVLNGAPSIGLSMSAIFIIPALVTLFL